MNTTFAALFESDAAFNLADDVSLVFVEDAEYEFVSGGAASTNTI